jgi:predicted nucleotidyltransferase
MEPSTLPPSVEKSLELFVDSVKEAFGADLRSVVLFGSTAEGRWRPVSDVNVLVVLSSFSPEKAAQVHDPYAAAHSAVKLKAMFLLEPELTEAAELFAVKFTDIGVRHRVLFGHDPFEKLQIPQEAARRRLRQVLTNLSLRLRERYVLEGPDQDRLLPAIADAIGPLRSCALSILNLEGGKEEHPREALEKFLARIQYPNAKELLQRFSDQREKGTFPAGKASETLFALIAIADKMRSTLGPSA